MCLSEIVIFVPEIVIFALTNHLFKAVEYIFSFKNKTFFMYDTIAIENIL